MEIYTNDTSKIVEVWLSRHEKEALKQQLASCYQKYRENGYLVVVYESGEQDLYESTRNLLLLNRESLSVNRT